ncbi:MAG: type II CAAX endopeptidase family protein [Planctomycetota bacterium]
MNTNLPVAQPRIWTCFVYPLVALVVAVVLQGLMGVVMALSMIADGVAPGDVAEKIMEQVANPGFFLLNLALGQFAFALLVIVPAFFSKGQAVTERLGLRPVERPLEVYAYTLTGSMFMLTIAIGAAYLVAMIGPRDDSIATFFENITPGWGVLFVITIALLPGFIEELLFRGYIQQRFLTRWSPTTSILVTSVLFALVHIMPPAIALAFILGIWLGFIGWRTHSILPCIACHAFINGGLNAWRLIAIFGELSEMTVNIVHVTLTIIGLIGFVLAIRLLLQLEPPTSTPMVTETLEHEPLPIDGELNPYQPPSKTIQPETPPAE